MDWSIDERRTTTDNTGFASGGLIRHLADAPKLAQTKDPKMFSASVLRQFFKYQ